MKKLLRNLLPVFYLSFVQPGVAAVNGVVPTSFVTVNVAPAFGIDNSLTIQNAIGLLPTNSGALVNMAPNNPGVSTTTNYTQYGGGTVQFSQGIFPCGSEILIPDSYSYNITFLGAGKQSTVLLLTNNLTTPFLTESLGVPNSGKHTTVNFQNLAICYATNVSNILVYLPSIQYSSFKSVTFGDWYCFTNGGWWPGENPAQPELTVLCYVGATGDNTEDFDNCMFMGGAVGLGSSSDHLRVHSCDFFYNGTYKVGSSSTVFTNGYTTNAASGQNQQFGMPAGLLLFSSSLGDVSIVNNHFFGCGIGIADLTANQGISSGPNFFEGTPVALASVWQGNPVYGHTVYAPAGIPSFGTIIHSGQNYILKPGTNTGFCITGDSAIALNTGASIDNSYPYVANITPTYSRGILIGGTNLDSFNGSFDQTSYWPPTPMFAGEAYYGVSNGVPIVLSDNKTGSWVSTNVVASSPSAGVSTNCNTGAVHLFFTNGILVKITIP